MRRFYKADKPLMLDTTPIIFGVPSNPAAIGYHPVYIAAVKTIEFLVPCEVW
jgi:hypothetical protein